MKIIDNPDIKGVKMDPYIGKGIASVAVCAGGAISMYVTNGNTGIGWSVLGLLIIWG